jgi:hypothetical protein
MRWIEKIAHGCEYRSSLEDPKAIVVVYSQIQVNSIRKNEEGEEEGVLLMPIES